ncbi:hypothetical protein D480_0224785 [Pseudomonas aeruginosa]|nr:hypothetical protein D480_0224785 [Pseudomonas aeruginosa]
MAQLLREDLSGLPIAEPSMLNVWSKGGDRPNDLTKPSSLGAADETCLLCQCSLYCRALFAS